MKKFFIIAGAVIMVIAVASCNKVRRSPGRAYMPDMTYSRAYETYASTQALTDEHVNYNAKPVEGTVARGDMFPYRLQNNSADSFAAISNKNPLEHDKIDFTEAERLYLVNCGICHGTKLDGNGPLYKGGDGPFPAKPATLVGDAKYEAMTDGSMFQSVTYGKNAMGSYASQLSTKQRWMVIAYIKSKQGGAKTGTASADSTKGKSAVMIDTTKSKTGK